MALLPVYTGLKDPFTQISPKNVSNLVNLVELLICCQQMFHIIKITMMHVQSCSFCSVIIIGTIGNDIC